MLFARIDRTGVNMGTALARLPVKARAEALGLFLIADIDRHLIGRTTRNPSVFVKGEVTKIYGAFGTTVVALPGRGNQINPISLGILSVSIAAIWRVRQERIGLEPTLGAGVDRGHQCFAIMGIGFLHGHMGDQV